MTVSIDMNLVVISDNYPSDRMPNKGAFVYNLIQELSRYHNITVVAPFKIHDLLKFKRKDGYGKERCRVYRPLYFSFSNKKILFLNTGRWTKYFIAKAVKRCLNDLPTKPDLIYAHFLSNAQSALPYIKENSTPLIIASGESSYANFLEDSTVSLKELRGCTSHIVCVSETNKSALKELKFDENRITVIPNAVDLTLFKPLEKNKCKEKLGISTHKFVVGFVGHFIHRKGPNRIIDAIKILNDKDIELVCVGGKGNLTPNNFTTVIAPLPNYELPQIYNAFDIFVLPTLSEGHCNVIEEAKACCIPIVSSIGTSVEEQVDQATAILVDPMDAGKIAEAIFLLKEDKSKRDQMIANLSAQRGRYSIKKRGEKINSVLESIHRERFEKSS